VRIGTLTCLGWIVLATACSSAPPAAPAAPLPEAPPPSLPAPVPEAQAAAAPLDGCQFVGRVAAVAPPDAAPSVLPVYTAPAASPLAGTCSSKACSSGLHIELSHAGGWAPGRYRVEVETEWGNTSCLATVGPGQAPGLGPIVFSSAPSQVRIHIERDRQQLVDRELSSKYTTRRHDGVACPASCRFAEERVPVP